MTTPGKNATETTNEVPKDMYVKLVSSDGHEFYIKRDLVLTSQTIKAMLSGPGLYAENETNIIQFPSLSSQILARICSYFAYKTRYSNSTSEIPEFPIPPDQALELLMAANFLDC